jgi:hypothetical protein
MFRTTISLFMQIFKWLIMVEVKSNNAAAKLLGASPYIHMPIEKHVNTLHNHHHHTRHKQARRGGDMLMDSLLNACR